MYSYGRFVYKKFLFIFPPYFASKSNITHSHINTVIHVHKIYSNNTLKYGKRFSVRPLHKHGLQKFIKRNSLEQGFFKINLYKSMKLVGGPLTFFFWGGGGGATKYSTNRSNHNAMKFLLHVFSSPIVIALCIF